MSTNEITINEERRYWLTGSENKPLPRNITGSLQLLVIRSYRVDSIATPPMNGEIRSNALKVTIDLPEPRGINARPNGFPGPGIRLLNSEASWDFSSNLVKIGGGFIEVLSAELRSYGIGALFMNMAIGWAHAYHPDAAAHQLAIKADQYQDRRKAFYGRFGYKFMGARNEGGNLLSEPTQIARLNLGEHPLIDSEANCQRPRSI